MAIKVFVGARYDTTTDKQVSYHFESNVSYANLYSYTSVQNYSTGNPTVRHVNVGWDGQQQNYQAEHEYVSYDFSAVPTGESSVECFMQTYRTASGAYNGAYTQAGSFYVYDYDWHPWVQSTSRFPVPNSITQNILCTFTNAGGPPDSAWLTINQTNWDAWFSRSGICYAAVICKGWTDEQAITNTGTTWTLWGRQIKGGTFDSGLWDPRFVFNYSSTSQLFTDDTQTVSWQVPANVTSIQMRAWGGGSGGGTGANQEPGGAGGGAVRSVVSVTPSETLYIRVGAGGAAGSAGGASWVSRNSGGSNPIVYAPGGLAAVSGSYTFTENSFVGDYQVSGGYSPSEQGGGGGRGGCGGGAGGGIINAGGAGEQKGGSNSIGGAGGVNDDGTGGAGGKGADAGTAAENGSIPGGGGGGRGSGTSSSGSGARGQVTFDYNAAASSKAAPNQPAITPMLNLLSR